MSDYNSDRPRLDEWPPEWVQRSPAAVGDYTSIPDTSAGTDASGYFYRGFHPLDIRRCDGCSIREREPGFKPAMIRPFGGLGSSRRLQLCSECGDKYLTS